MRTGPEIQMTPAQREAIIKLRDQLLRDAPTAEVKEWSVAQPTSSDVAGALADVVLVRVELGFPGDSQDFRVMLRDRRTYLISRRGRIEAWNAKRAFRVERKTRRRPAARAAQAPTPGIITGR